MRISVCMKQVPKTTDIKIDPVTNTLIRDGVPSIVNPDDKAALEFALRIKEETGAEINVVCMGPAQAENALRETLAMGADNAYLISDRAFAGSDTLATSTILSAALNKIGFDAIIAGRQAIDGDTAQVGPQIAEILGLPQVTYCADVKFDEEKNEFTLKRQSEDRVQTLKVKGKVLLTVLSGSVKARYMNVKDIVKQESKAINVITYDDLLCDKATIGLAGSPTKVKTTFTKQFNTEKDLIETTPQEAAKIIAEHLKAQHLI
ncbi:MAG: electron transfer flavoprotein subunit beta/FixA family protein [Clostridia bacterium]|nr:electron transfer flavoprotein subunit beta/FixA family protein [Clostridia bacterium]